LIKTTNYSLLDVEGLIINKYVPENDLRDVYCREDRTGVELFYSRPQRNSTHQYITQHKPARGNISRHNSAQLGMWLTGQASNVIVIIRKNHIPY
jgi:hypothetical protein